MSTAVKAEEMLLHPTGGDVSDLAQQLSIEDSGSYRQRLNKAITDYLLKAVPDFASLCRLRQIGWENPAADNFFAKQRTTADSQDRKYCKSLFKIMHDIARDMHEATGAFRFLDITMLAANMGITVIPANHPDAENFLPRHFTPDQMFDLVMCDAQVLRTQPRAAYREPREATRLILTQLVLGLEHVKPGGTMIVYLHRAEAPRTVQLLYAFDKFATAGEAVMEIEKWKTIWGLATFEMDDDVFKQGVDLDGPDLDTILEQFGPRMVDMGTNIWKIQADALEKAPFITNMVKAE
ncbi:hypothetical protein BJX99DRAFT_247019 [Aspergillus californicus]